VVVINLVQESTGQLFCVELDDEEVAGDVPHSVLRMEAKARLEACSGEHLGQYDNEGQPIPATLVANGHDLEDKGVAHDVVVVGDEPKCVPV
jgi:hypothetical protein